jgi:hypothetical protein
MSGFAGFDRDMFPGLGTMQQLMSNTNLAWSGYYLTPAPSQGRQLGWMGNRAALVAQGFGLAPIYVGQQDPATSVPPGVTLSTTLTAAQGAIDASQAVNLAAGEGFPSFSGPTGQAGSTIYLDIEIGGPISQAYLDYVGAWIQGVFNEGYTAGAYCNAASHVTDQLRALDSRVVCWGISLGQFSCAQSSSTPYPVPDPAGCGFGDASLWQLLQGCVLTVGGRPLTDDNGRPLNVDLDTCLATDPSSISTPPSATTPVVTSISPTSGSAQGGDQVMISGSGFTNVTGVGFGGAGAPNVAFLSDQQVSAISPPGSGAVEIQVVTSGGSSALDPQFDEFTYV